MNSYARRGGTTPWIVLLGVAAIAVAIGVQAWKSGGVKGGAASSGSGIEVFSKTMTLEEAKAAASSAGKPVLVFATADWCAPCQKLKHETLADSRVAERVGARTVAIYMDVTNGVPRDAAGLKIQGIPAMIALRDGKEVSRLVGYRGTDDFLKWLDSL